jgi:hypothetical protein
MPINHQTQTTFAYSFQDGSPSDPYVSVPQRDYRLLCRLLKLFDHPPQQQVYDLVTAVWPGLSSKQRAVITDIVSQNLL